MTARTTESKAMNRLKSYIPILDWLPTYNKQWLRPDLIAALTVWALLVPEAMAYATLAGVPPEAGLYAAPLALLGYAIFGTSRQLVVGPSSTVAVMSAVVVGTFAVSGTEEYITLTAVLALLVGILFILAGLLKLGFLADFMSRPVLSGLVVGIAITIVMGQLDKILGYEIPESRGFLEELYLFIRGLGNIHWMTFVVGAISLVLLFGMEELFPKIPGALVVVALGIVVSALLNLESYGVHIVGDIPAGLPQLGFQNVSLRDIIALMPGAIGILLVAFAESVAAARAYAKKHGYEIRASQEMVGLGIANFGSGFSQGFVVDGSLSRTAAADQAGQKTQLASIINAVLVLVTAAFLTPLFRSLPEAVLGAIVIHAVWHLISFTELRRLYNIRRIDFWAGSVALIGVLMFGILGGLLLAVFLSFFALLARASDPEYAILGSIPGQGREVFGNIEMHPEAHTYPGLIIFRFDQQLFFANAPKFRAHVHEAIDASTSPVRVVLIDAEDIPDIDSSALDMLIELREELEVKGVDLWFARINKNVEEYMRLSTLTQQLGDGHIFLSVRAGVDAFQEQAKELDRDQ
ncbi:MAG: solute carrier family 26 protein [Candidatus Promineifilaceae bacterium]